jgi:hypothetical protein
MVFFTIPRPCVSVFLLAGHGQLLLYYFQAMCTCPFTGWPWQTPSLLFLGHVYLSFYWLAMANSFFTIPRPCVSVLLLAGHGQLLLH